MEKPALLLAVGLVTWLALATLFSLARSKIQRENRHVITAIALTQMQATQHGHSALQQEPSEQLSKAGSVQGPGRIDEQSLASSSGCSWASKGMPASQRSIKRK